MTVEYLSEDQIARYGRFVGEPSAHELEAFFRLDAVAIEQAAAKRRPHNRLGWAVQWGTVRMLGTFLSAPAEVPPVVAEFVGEQSGVEDPSCLKLYPERLPTQHEHAREIRKLLGVRDFDEGDLALREYIAGRVRVSNEGPRALFDLAVTWLLRNRVLMPGLTPLAYLVAEVRKGEQALICSVVDAPVDPGVPPGAAGAPGRSGGGRPVGAGGVAQGASGCVGAGVEGRVGADAGHSRGEVR
ncbi:DUF4158 domain-containing protein [Streptomyces sp. NPDC101062]|uniref:DUF4158 domain-containing protein n=1 Tax=unclassified Streptomyces TaxID=2593676 RepID=UPI00381C6B0F